MKPTDFPKLQAAAEINGRLPRFNEAVETLAEAVEAGTIFNVDLKDVKDCLNRRMDEADAVLRAVWTNSGRWEALPAEVFSLVQDLSSNLSNVHGAIAASKKLSKSKLSHPAVEAYRAVAAEGLVLAEALVSLKDKVVMGRKPDPAAQARKAAKLANVVSMARATCACCGKEQAVLPNGLIHDHGYTLPQAWMKTGSCYGRQFRPLEVSDEGLKFMVKLLSSYVADREQVLASIPTRTEIIVTNRFSKKTTTVKKGEPDFARRISEMKYEVEADLKAARRDLSRFEKALIEWAPKAK